MLFDYIYLLENIDFDFSNAEDLQIAEFIIPVEDKIISQNKTIFQKLSTTENRFCFYLPKDLAGFEDSYIKENVFRNIIRLLFLPNYLKINDKYLLFIEQNGQPDDRFKNIREIFAEELRKQGISDPIIESFSLEPNFSPSFLKQNIALTDRSLIEFLTTAFTKGSFEKITREFSLPKDFDKKWIIPVSTNEDYEQKVRQIEQFETGLSHSYPLNMQLINMFKKADKERSVLQTAHDTMKFKLENSSLSLKLVREEARGYVDEVDSLRREVTRLANQINNPGASPAMDSLAAQEAEEMITQLRQQTIAEHNRGDQILAWYKKEYEVLPLWYKKFGHLVKVLTGKRTFKSLFK